MANKIQNKYVVIRFEELPYENINDCVCVPRSWIRTFYRKTENKGLVAYPIEDPALTRQRVERRELFKKSWQVFVAVIIKCDIDDYDEANILIGKIMEDEDDDGERLVINLSDDDDSVGDANNNANNGQSYIDLTDDTTNINSDNETVMYSRNMYNCVKTELNGDHSELAKRTVFKSLPQNDSMNPIINKPQMKVLPFSNNEETLNKNSFKRTASLSTLEEIFKIPQKIRRIKDTVIQRIFTQPTKSSYMKHLSSLHENYLDKFLSAQEIIVQANNVTYDKDQNSYPRSDDMNVTFTVQTPIYSSNNPHQLSQQIPQNVYSDQPLNLNTQNIVGNNRTNHPIQISTMTQIKQHTLPRNISDKQNIHGRKLIITDSQIIQHKNQGALYKKMTYNTSSDTIRSRLPLDPRVLDMTTRNPKKNNGHSSNLKNHFLPLSEGLRENHNKQIKQSVHRKGLLADAEAKLDKSYHQKGFQNLDKTQNRPPLDTTTSTANNSQKESQYISFKNSSCQGISLERSFNIESGKQSNVLQNPPKDTRPAGKPSTPSVELPSTPSVRLPSTPPTGQHFTQYIGQSSTPLARQLSTPPAGKPSTLSAGQPPTPSVRLPSTPPTGQHFTQYIGQSSTPLARQLSTPPAGKPSTLSAGQPPTPSVGLPSTPPTGQHFNQYIGQPSTPLARQLSTPSAGNPSTLSAAQPPTPSIGLPFTPPTGHHSNQYVGQPSTPLTRQHSIPPAEKPYTPSTGQPSYEQDFSSSLKHCYHTCKCSQKDQFSSVQSKPINYPINTQNDCNKNNGDTKSADTKNCDNVTNESTIQQETSLGQEAPTEEMPESNINDNSSSDIQHSINTLTDLTFIVENFLSGEIKNIFKSNDTNLVNIFFKSLCVTRDRFCKYGEMGQKLIDIFTQKLEEIKHEATPSISLDVTINKTENIDTNKCKNENCNYNSAKKQRDIKRSFLLPKEYNSKNSKWTLKYKKAKTGVVELIAGSEVFIDKNKFEQCKQTSKDCTTLARKLLVEIFTEKALSNCSLTGARQIVGDRNGTNIRPGLDEHARIILVMFVEQYGRQNNWCVNDKQTIINSLRNKIQDLRSKAKNILNGKL